MKQVKAVAYMGPKKGELPSTRKLICNFDVTFKNKR